VPRFGSLVRRPDPALWERRDRIAIGKEDRDPAATRGLACARVIRKGITRVATPSPGAPAPSFVYNPHEAPAAVSPAPALLLVAQSDSARPEAPTIAFRR
jgi:hypothetical protein